MFEHSTGQLATLSYVCTSQLINHASGPSRPVDNPFGKNKDAFLVHMYRSLRKLDVKERSSTSLGKVTKYFRL
jgi:hypothetical protein